MRNHGFFGAGLDVRACYSGVLLGALVVQSNAHAWQLKRSLVGLACICMLVAGCGNHKGPATAGSGTGPASSDASVRDAGEDAAAGRKTNTAAAPFGFKSLGVDAAVPGSSRADGGGVLSAPDGWRCREDLGKDAICDCGCGAADGACATLGCATAGCSLPVCQACFDANGEPRDCGAPGAWICEHARLGDGICDCGCGALDPDCAPSRGCYQSGCNVEGCQLCRGADGEAACAMPPAFRCLKSVKGDGKCDCGCGNYDPDCKHSSCLEANCNAAGCEVCHDRSGKPVACKPSTPGFSCESSRRGDGVCDCGCGEPDPDCQSGRGCALAGCEAQGCEVCHDAFGRELPCPGSWTCDAALLSDGSSCDCGCGRRDPDCGDAGCTEANCTAAKCDVRHDAEGHPIRPETWSCTATAYAGSDGCDCGCGAPDPDCRGGCSEPGCRAEGCDRCRLEGGALFECRWSCELTKLGAGDGCDCGCGAIDPDCSKLGCYEAGCYAAACEHCFDSSGKEYPCQRGACAAGYQNDGVCDCGCREVDGDCMAASACVEPGCSAQGCGRCHDASGAHASCKDWICGLERQGGKDGCNCGCGAPDPDCDSARGCAIPGCAAEGCITCRSSDGAPMSCSP